jgi:hypothetical protein
MAERVGKKAQSAALMIFYIRFNCRVSRNRRKMIFCRSDVRWRIRINVCVCMRPPDTKKQQRGAGLATLINNLELALRCSL